MKDLKKMLIVEFDLIGVSPLSFSKAILVEKETGETHDAFEERTWMERLHVDNEGNVFIPARALKNSLDATAKHLSESVPGKRQATYTKHFVAGTMVIDNMMLGIKKDNDKIIREKLFVPADGTRGGRKRVNRSFPTIIKWQVHCKIYIFDPVLIAKPEKVHEYLIFNGKFIGFLRFRPAVGGTNGRFEVKNFRVVPE